MVAVTGYPATGPRDRVEALSPGLPEIKEKSGGKEKVRRGEGEVDRRGRTGGRWS